jgi:hypothetical protein
MQTQPRVAIAATQHRIRTHLDVVRLGEDSQQVPIAVAEHQGDVGPILVGNAGHHINDAIRALRLVVPTVALGFFQNALDGGGEAIALRREETGRSEHLLLAGLGGHLPDGAGGSGSSGRK